MGLLEEIALRAQMLPPAQPFPDFVPPAEVPRDHWSLADLPQNLLPPHWRNRTQAVDANSLGIQAALGNIPEGPAIPRSMAMHLPGMVPLDQANSPYTTPAGRQMMAGVGVDAPVEPIPVPRARPAEAPALVSDDGASPAWPAMAQPSTDVSARAKVPGTPLQIAPPVAASPTALAPEAGMIDSGGGPSILDRIRTGLGDNSNTLLALGAGFAGAPNIGHGISRAAAAAIPASQADIRNRLFRQSQTYGAKALIDAGVPPLQAQAAQGNPELYKALVQNYIVDRKKEVKETGMDRYGNKVFQLFDPFTGKLTPLDGAASSGLNGPVTAETDVTGPDYLAKLKENDPAYARQVEQVLNGDAAMPTGRAAITPFGRKLRQDVLTVEPGSSDSDFSTRQKTQQSYTSGNDAKVTKSINTTLHHAETLERAINDLDNFSTLPSVLNPIRSAIKGEYDPKYQKAKGQYETAVANFAKELDFAVSGGRPTVSGTKHQMEGFNLNAPKTEQLAKLQEGVDLLKGRLDSHAEGYSKGRRTAREPIDFVDPVNRKFYQRVLGEGGATIGTPPSTAAPAPAPGRYIFDPETGKLVPAQ